MSDHKPPCPGPDAHVTKDGGSACIGHHKVDGLPCQGYPVTGQTVCRMHGGSSPQAKKKASERLELQKVEADAKALLAHRGLAGITDPLNELARTAAEVIAFKDALAARVNSLSDIRYRDAKDAEQLRAEVALYERALDRTGKFLEVLVRAGFEQRITRLREEHGALIVQVLQRVFAALDLTVEQQAVVSTVVPAELRLIDGGAA
jgi:hypothetical protein